LALPLALTTPAREPHASAATENASLTKRRFSRKKRSKTIRGYYIRTLKIPRVIV